MKRIICTVILIFSVAAIGFAADYYAEDIYVPTGVDSGLGGPYPTDNEGLETIFSNPAAFKSAQEDLVFSNFTLQLTGPIFDIASLIIGSLSAGEDMTTLLTSPSTQAILTGLYSGFSITGPIYFGYVGDGFGFGLFNTTDFLLRGKGPLSISMDLGEQLLLAGGYSFRIPLSDDEKHVLDIGVMLKGGVEGVVAIEKSFLELPTMLDSIGADLFLSEPFEFSTIIGMDAGLLYIWDGFMSAGLSFQDCFSPTARYTYVGGINDFLDSETAAPDPESGIVPFKVNAGVEFNPTIPIIQQFITDFRFMAAYDDIFDFLLYPTEAEHWLLHIKTGLEITMLEILDIRVGLADGLLNAGLGLDLKIFTLNAAMFGTEQSSQPGTKPVYNLTLGFMF